MEEGRKDDQDKLRYDLIPPEALEGLALVYTIGAKKYADRNWENGLVYGRIYGALFRHIQAWIQGEDYDPDGQHHLDSVAWCAFALRTYEARNMQGFDNLRRKSENRKAKSLVSDWIAAEQARARDRRSTT